MKRLCMLIFASFAKNDQGSFFGYSIDINDVNEAPVFTDIALLLKDIRTGSISSSASNFANVNGTLYFTADNGINGTELWKSDGTATSTVLLKDIRTGSIGSSPSNLTNINGTLYFTADDGVNGRELWKSDGTAAGTVLVTNINPGSRTSNPSNITNVDGTLYFRATNINSGEELWKSDGTAAGTVLVKDIWVGSTGSSYPSNLTNINGTLYFAANDGINGRELWKSDGTAADTVMVKNIATGNKDSSIYNLTNVNGTLYFTADDGINGIELWKSDGSTVYSQIGSVSKPIFQGNFTISYGGSGSSSSFTDQNLANDLKIAGLNPTFTGISIGQNEIGLSGNLALPSSLGGSALSISLGDSPTKNNALKITNSGIKLGNDLALSTTNFSLLNRIPVKVPDFDLNYDQGQDILKLQGSLNIIPFFKSTGGATLEADLSGSNFIQIKNAKADLVGKLSLNNLKFSDNWGVDEASLTIDTINNLVGGDIDVEILGDTIYEPNETFSVVLTGAGNGTIAKNSAVGTIVDNDLPVTLSVLDTNVVEGDSGTKNLLFQVGLSAVNGQQVTVNYSTANGTAIAGSDYAATTGTLTFLPGTTVLNVAVPIVGDTVSESDETLFLNISNATGGTVISKAQGTATIINDDGLSGGLNLIGTTGNDILSGAGTNDTLKGLAGADVLDGQGGADRFVYNALTDSLLTGRDAIRSFNPGEGDRIDVGFIPGLVFNVGSVATSIGVSAVTAAYTAANSGSGLGANQAVFFTTGSGRTYRLYLSVNDGTAGFNANNDLVMEVTGMIGAPSNIGDLTANNYFATSLF